MRGRTTAALAAAFLSTANVFVLKTYFDAEFLAEFGARWLPHFFVAQSLALMALSAAYAAIRRPRVRLSADLFVLLATVALAVTASWLFNRGAALVFGVSLAFFSLTALTAMAVWNAAMSGVPGREARRFVGRMAAVATSGAVVGSFASSALIVRSGVAVLAPFGAGLAAALVLLLLFLRRKVERAAPAASARPNKRREARPSAHAARALVRALLVAGALEAFLGTVLDYGFKRELSAALERDQIGFFLSLFHGVTNLVMLLVQWLAIARLLASCSLRWTLSIIPMTLSCGALVWALLPVLWVAAVVRGSEVLLRYAIARPALEIAVLPLSDSLRQRVKVLYRGVFIQGGAAGAGLLLVAIRPLLQLHLAVVPALALTLGLALWWLQRRVSRLYLQALQSTLGMRHFLDPPIERPELDADGVAEVLALAGGAEAETTAFVRHLLQQADTRTRHIEQHLTSPRPDVRRGAYRLLAERSDASHEALAAAVAEDQARPGTYASGLDALARHGDPSQLENARERTRSLTGDDRALAVDQRAALFYLAELDAMDPVQSLETVDRLLPQDGPRSAQLLHHLLLRGAATREPVDRILASAIANDPDNPEVWKAVAAAGTVRQAELLLERVQTSHDAAALAALPHLADSTALELYQRVADAPARTRRQRLRWIGLQGGGAAAALAGSALDEPDPTLRSTAVTLLLRISRENPAALPRDSIEQAIDRELEALEARRIARGRLPPERDWIQAELEQEIREATERILLLASLLGHGREVQAAERELRSDHPGQRQQALDLLQELLVTRHKGRLIACLEQLLEAPPPDRPAAPEELAAQSPWLATCFREHDQEWTERLSLLRRSALFRQVPGPALEPLARAATLRDLTAGETVVEQGQSGEALYVVARGELHLTSDHTPPLTLQAGEAFGELTVLDQQPRQATLTARAPARVLRLSREPFLAALRSHAALRLGLVQGIARWGRT